MKDSDIAEIWELLKKNNIDFTTVPLILNFKQIADDTKALQKEKQTYIEEVEAELSKNKNIVFSEKAEVIVSYNIKTYEVTLYAFKSNLTLDEIKDINGFTTIDLSGLNFDTEKIDLSALNKNKVETLMLRNVVVPVKRLKFVFFNKQATKIIIESCQFPNVTTAKDLFAMCHSLKELKITNTTFPKLEDASEMFDSCSSIERIDISFLEASHNIKNIRAMFGQCFNLVEIKGLDKLDTTHIENMNSTFARCYKLKNIDLSTWKTEQCKDFNEMFISCDSLEYLNIKHFKFNMIPEKEIISKAFYMQSHIKCEIILDKKIEISECSDDDIASILDVLNKDIIKGYETPDVYNLKGYSECQEAMDKLMAGIFILVGDINAKMKAILSKDEASYKEIVDKAKTKASIFDSEFRDCKFCSLYISNEREGKVITVYTIE